MISKLQAKIKSHWINQDERSKKILLNTILSFLVKGGSIIVGLLLIPMTIDYVNSTQYGIWLTISSIVGWASFFDIGLGNGLRNKLAICLAQNQYDDAKKYISTTYATLTIISATIFVIAAVINPLIKWEKLLNIPENVNLDINNLISIIFSLFCLQFIFQLINIVLLASQKSALSSFISFLSQFLILISVFFLGKNTPGNLLTLCFILAGVPVIVLIVSNFILFNTQLKYIKPSFNYLDFFYSKILMNSGVEFFIIQIGAIILYNTDNIIISKIISLEAVTEFNIAHKYFTSISMVFLILLAPYWSAFTDAYAKEDFLWMSKTLKVLRGYWYFFALIIIPIFLLFSNFLYKFWIRDLVKISFSLSACTAIYAIGYMGMVLNCYILNGIGKVRIQLILYLVSIVINIPLSIFLGKYLGTQGIILSNIIIFIIMNIIFWIQINKIITQSAKGIWSK